MKLDSSRALLIRLMALAFLVLVPPVAILSWQALSEFEKGMVPELDRKAATVGRDLVGQIERAVGYGIPLDRLVGVEDFFAPLLNANPEIRYLAVTDRVGAILFLQGGQEATLAPHYRSAETEIDGADGRKALIAGFVDLALPISGKTGQVGLIHVGVDEGYVKGRLAEIAVDVAVVLLVSLLVAFEILLFVVAFNVSGPIHVVSSVVNKARRGDFTNVVGVSSEDEVGRFVRLFNGVIRQLDEYYRKLADYIDEVKTAHFDKTVIERVADVEARVKFLFRFAASGGPEPMTRPSVTDIRLPLFLFVFAEEISRSFLPLYVRELSQPLWGLPPDMLIALPIAAFMAAIAIISPWAGMLTGRLGSRRVFLIGLVPALGGYAMAALAWGLYDFILWRVISAVGYAIVTMAGQGYISEISRQEARAQGLGAFVGAVLTASVCGTVIGGVLAERLGFRLTFAVSTLLVLASGLLVLRLLGGASSAHRDLREPTSADVIGVLRNWRFTLLMLLAAIPAKMALTGFLFFLLPLRLAADGFSIADTARVMVLYPLAVVILSPLVARFADRFGCRSGLVAVGGLIGGAALLLPLWLPGDDALLLGALLLGVSHGLSSAPQLAIVPDICWIECRAIGQTNVLGLVRLIERLGSVIGPLLAASFIPFHDQNGAVVALGGVVMALAGLFVLAAPAYRAGPYIQAEEG